MEQRRERGPAASRPDFMQRLEQRADLSSKAAASATSLSTAMKPLWASLDDSQKRLLPILMRPAGGMRAHYARGGDHRQHGMMRQGQRGPAPQAQ